MANKVVGDADCSYSDITSVMLLDDGFTDMRRKWKDIANLLNLKTTQIDDIQYSNLDLQPSGLMNGILVKWRSLYASNATLEVLLECLEKTGFNNIVKALETKFNVARKNSGKKNPSSLDTSSHQESMETTVRVDGGVMSVMNQATSNDDDLRSVDPSRLIPGSVLLPTQPMNFGSDDYNLPCKDKGLSLLINVLEFEKSPNRTDAQIDSHLLVYLFAQLGYLPETYHGFKKDFTKQHFEKVIDTFKLKCIEDFKAKCNEDRNSSFVVFLGSHGGEGKLELPDGWEKWHKMPEMFFIEACRLISTAAEDDERIENCIISQSCMPSKPAYHHQDGGTHYVRALTKVFREEARRNHLKRMLDMVEYEVSNATKNLVDDTGNKRESQRPHWQKIGKFGRLYFTLPTWEEQYPTQM